jgi:hypothetical protein
MHTGALLSEEGWVVLWSELEPPLGGGSGERYVRPKANVLGSAEYVGERE